MVRTTAKVKDDTQDDKAHNGDDLDRRKYELGFAVGSCKPEELVNAVPYAAEIRV